MYSVLISVNTLIKSYQIFVLTVSYTIQYPDTVCRTYRLHDDVKYPVNGLIYITTSYALSLRIGIIISIQSLRSPTFT